MNAFLSSFLVLAALTGELPFEAPETTGPSVTDAPHTRVRLVAAADAAIAGKPLEVAVVLETEPGWHTYWLNPGDAGMATSVAWKLPKGWRAGALQWPAPSRFQEKEVATFGYEGTAWLLATLEPPPSARTGSPVSVAARVDFLECREICLPGSAEVTLTLPVKQGSAATPLEREAFAAARAKLPVPASDWKVHASWTKDGLLSLALAPPAGVALDENAFFFPEQPGIVDPSGTARLTRAQKGGYSLDLVPARLSAGSPPTLSGVLVSGGRAWHVRVPLPPREI